jgi:hypothetical protein
MAARPGRSQNQQKLLDRNRWVGVASTLVKLHYEYFALGALVAVAMLPAASYLVGQTPPNADRLVVYGDVVYFYPPGNARNCILNNRFKRGEPVGFRMTAINPATGKRDRATQLVVHLTYDGKTIDLPMRDRQNEKAPERDFFVAKWVVPDDASTGIVRYTVTAKDPQGRTGEFKPFEVQASQITIIE